MCWWCLFQGAALVNIYTDGTVLISYCGVEMGQGLHIKLMQVTVCVCVCVLGWGWGGGGVCHSTCCLNVCTSHGLVLHVEWTSETDPAKADRFILKKIYAKKLKDLFKENIS